VIKSRRKRWVGRVARTGDRRGAYRVLVNKFEGKRSHGRPRRRWQDNIKIDLQKLKAGKGWIDLAQDRDSWRVLLNVVVNLRVP
jgi:hypothetical protein